MTVVDFTSHRLSKQPIEYSIEIRHLPEKFEWTLFGVQPDARSMHSVAHYLGRIIDAIYEEYPREDEATPQQQGVQADPAGEDEDPGSGDGAPDGSSL
jgi:hypothetical protein